MGANPKSKTQNPKFLAFFQRGTELLREGRAAEAIPLLERAHGLDGEHVDAALNLSAAYILGGRFRQAVAKLEALSQAAPDNVMVWTNLGAAYLGNPVLATGEMQLRAIAAFEKALAINPIAPNVAYNIGLIYLDRQEREQAVAWFERALQANPHDRDAQRRLGRLTTPKK
ncbi:MAG: tetratricopeptide repeat protein [Chloroflexota bacterium]